MKSILLFPNSDKDPGLEMTRNAAAILSALGTECMLPPGFEDFGLEDAETVPLEDALNRAGMVVTIGGDGTMLRAAPLTLDKQLPILGVNAGRIGFLTEVEKNELYLLAKVACGEYTLDRRIMLDVKLYRDGSLYLRRTALNDAVVRNAGPQAAELELLVDGRLMTRVTGDGLIAATPTGSTAYSMSAGGPIVEPGADCLVVTPVCPHALYAHSFVLSGNRRLTIQPSHPAQRPVHVVVDGSEPVPLAEGDKLHVTRSEAATTFCRLKDRQFYDMIHHKL